MLVIPSARKDFARYAGTSGARPRAESVTSFALAGANTPELDEADNDYAVGLVVQTIANSACKNDTLIFVIELQRRSVPSVERTAARGGGGR